MQEFIFMDLFSVEEKKVTVSFIAVAFMPRGINIEHIYYMPCFYCHDYSMEETLMPNSSK